MSITVHTPAGGACLRIIAAFACALGAACNTGVPDAAHTDRESAPQAAAASAQLRPYPRATWRLAREQLDRVILSVSHIAVRHEESEDADPYLRGPDWAPEPRAARRQAEAIAIVGRIADALHGDPSRFAELARQHSEDAVTAASGGSLGTVPASRLPPEFLDAIASLRPGEVSRPFATSFGIHVLKLEETPREQQLAASRVVIAYRNGGMGVLRPGRTRERSRAQALELARQVAAEARAPGSDFARLVERYSDSPDAAQAGDLGVWSTHSPAERGFILHAIAAVPEGGITDPVDSSEGFQVLKRTAADARERFAAEYVLLDHRSPEQREDARTKMAEVATVVRTSPERFETFQRQYCCVGSQVWTRGRAPAPGIERALAELREGEIARAPIETAVGFFLLKRLPAPPAPVQQALVRLPTPSEPNLDDVLRNVNGPGLARSLQLLRQSLAAAAPAEATRRALDELLQAAADAMSRAAPEERPAVLARFWADAAGVLPEPAVRQLRAHVFDFAKQQLMQD